MLREKYTYKNIPIPGGGYVTGFIFDEIEEGKLYLRTDIGGAYKWDKNALEWESISNHVNMNDLRETYPIALTKVDGKLYIVSGIWKVGNAKLSVSEDEGQSYTHYELPFMAHGNLNGRGTGERLLVDKSGSGKIWYASQAQGLWCCKKLGDEWTKVNALKEDFLTFVAQSPIEDNVIIVGSAGVTSATADNMRGPALFVSRDGGSNFEALEQPENIELPETLMSGVVAQRYSFDDKYLYVTFQCMGPNANNRELGYSCDNGSVWGGKIFRYDLINLKAQDITPDVLVDENGSNPMDSGGTFGRKYKLINENNLDILSFGLSGVDSSKKQPGLVVVSTLSKEDGDCIFRSLDYGDTWECIMHDLDTGVMDFRTEYMKPPYNGGHNLVHWMSDLKINPFNPNELWFNTGTGPFRTTNLLDREVHFSDYADGIEETVHINVYSPHSGEVKVLDIVGDLGGFAFKELDIPCDNSFADENGNRYITCLNADYSDIDPSTVIVTARGNWTGKTKGGLILSENQSESFERLDMPFGISEKIDSLLNRIEKPNVNPGWVSMSPGCENIIWSVCDGFFLPADSVVVSNDGGNEFEKVNIFDFDGKNIADDEICSVEEVVTVYGLWGRTPDTNDEEELENRKNKIKGFKSFSDRIKDDVFYGFGMHGEFYVSQDGGRNFYQKKLNASQLTDTILDSNFAFVDTINKFDIRCDNGHSGIFYISIREKGLWKLFFDFDKDEAILTPITKEGDSVYRVGLGVGKSKGDFLKDEKILYVAASISGEYGFYRMNTDGSDIVRINEDNQMYGEINSIAGDAREYGRFYLATGSRGLLYGEKES